MTPTTVWSRRPSLRAIGRALRGLALACAIALVVAACDQTPASRPSTSSALPTFSDWRAAYLGSDGHLHIVTLDAKKDIVGPQLSGMTSNYLLLSSAGFSPNGHLLAYIGADGLKVVDVTGRQDTSHIDNVGAPEVFWSPDGSQLALSEGKGTISFVNIADGRLTVKPGLQSQNVGEIIGWIDNTHLAVRLVPPATGSATQPVLHVGLGVLDIASWQVRTIASFASPRLGTTYFAVSPDGAEALYFNRQFRDDPYTPMVGEINIATGATTPLPQITQFLDPIGFTTLAWRPDTQTVVASRDYASNGNLAVWVLDLQHDTAQKLATGRYVAGWTPDNGPLMLTTGWQSATNQGPYEIDAATLVSDASSVTSTKALTRGAMTFPFLGFVRTA